MKQAAILIMTSKNNPSSMRSTTGTGWSKLYQAADCYLDLSYKQDGPQSLLLGQLLRQGGVSFTSAKATLLDPKGTPVQVAELTPKAGFRMVVGDLTAHRLELTLDQTTFDIALS
ncbi:hypothetical protein Mtai_v1c04120 [Meiothermus taiwanensis WR-220]|nr:hypothetical protein Mtai_v1c04120 [Meiothermus taiwanensis WR-220]KZK16155.1 hypothetical protein A3962_07350 [Meiothermus taiwanensis]